MMTFAVVAILNFVQMTHDFFYTSRMPAIQQRSEATAEGLRRVGSGGPHREESSSLSPKRAFSADRGWGSQV